MKLFLLFPLIFTVLLSSSTEREFKCISFNIRYGLADDGENSWKFRRHVVFDFINSQNADFLGLQEALLFQIEEIIENCPQYRFVGRSRQADDSEGEATPVLYNPEKWELIEYETRWLSETPEIPGSKSWNSSLPRIFTWASFKNRIDRQKLIVYNTHFDHISDEARYQSARQIIEHMRNHHPEENIILLGDFNALEINRPIQYFLNNDLFRIKDAYREIHTEEKDMDATFYGWQDHIPGTGKRIDYIFYKGKLAPVKVFVSDFNENNQFPSDHLPVVAIFR